MQIFDPLKRRYSSEQKNIVGIQLGVQFIKPILSHLSSHLIVSCQDTYVPFNSILVLPSAELDFASIFCSSDNVDLGTACGKYYRVCCLSIIDPGMLVCYAAVSLFLLYHSFLHFLFQHEEEKKKTDQLLHMYVSGDSDIIKSVPGDQ